VHSALILRLHICPFCIDIRLQLNQPVVTGGKCKSSNDNDEKQDGEDHAATECEFVHKAWNGSGNDLRSQLPHPSASRKKCASENFAFEPCRTMTAFSEGITNKR